jgi:hypothetical protein
MIRSISPQAPVQICSGAFLMRNFANASKGTKGVRVRNCEQF